MSDVPPPDTGDFVERDIDWTTRQQALASDPQRSAWVSANAGSGKTHVLSQRVIRLLLAGCRPAAILCLTYTRAAASEMANRVFDRLAEWTALDDESLAEMIAELEGARPEAKRLGFARQLFARALETPGGLKIQTIHAFCEAVLHQFPLEANVAGHFEVMDDATAARMLAESRQSLLSSVADGSDRQLAEAFEIVLEAGGEWGMDELFGDLVRKRQPIRRFLAAVERLGGVEPVLRKALQLSPDESERGCFEQAWPLPSLSAEDLAAYRSAALGQSAATPKSTSENIIAAGAEHDPQKRFTLLVDVFLKQDGQPRNFNRAASAKVVKVFPEIGEKLDDAALHIHAVADRLRTLRMLKATDAALVLAKRLDHDYEALKRLSGTLDFEDLVTRTASLLRRDGAGPWVHYKLDQGIDHILVDEAQDTSPDQWAVIIKLTEEFFAGKTSRNDTRTLFAVGDEKQSIYSFQGARPELFMQTGRDMGKRAFAAEKRFDPLNLYLSFRSTMDVLSAVDAVFSSESNRKGLSSNDDAITHASYRAREPGCVDVWEMIGKQSADDHEDWKAPFDATPESAPPAILARRVATTVRRWLDEGETIVEKGRQRPLTAGDILVLVRKRDGFVAALMRELKRNHIAVAGADRLRLVEHIAVEDLMALGRVMLLPGDDLSLCALLKSPLFGFDEDDLFHLAGRRPESESVFGRLAGLANSEGGRWADAHKYIAQLLARADRMPVFDFYARILGRDGGRAKFLARLGSEASDILDEFLSFALEQETTALPGLQAFLTTLEARSPEIKRELEQGRDEVRIMTVHASKGLEAPLVFLVDSGGKPAETLHMPKLRELPLEKTVGPLPPAVLWVPGKSISNATTEGLKDDILAASEDEYRRLLYVGMTRAADRLIICGYHGLRTPAYRHWHAMITESLGAHASCVVREYEVSGQNWQGFRFSVSEREQDFGAQTEGPGAVEQPAVPIALKQPLRSPERLPRPLAPSAAGVIIDPDTGAASTRSPLFDEPQSDGRPLERGRIVHRLLQLLPGVGPQEREAAASRYLERTIGEWPQHERDAILSSVLEILCDSAFYACFEPGSQAEVSVMGTLVVAGSERAISARLDRIAVTDDRVLIVDYKTNRPPVVSATDVPLIYRIQLALYRALLQPLYPGKSVEAALLYTEAPALVPLPETMLEDALAILEQESRQ
ncbi:MAG: double-strand break repair helicase AddA [Hyphomicrobiales bacterium]|nr:double-strand break repair helicase AddA [Hyphomicrobiales bacterium]